MAETVPMYVLLIVRHANTQTGSAFVKRVGWVLPVI